MPLRIRANDFIPFHFLLKSLSNLLWYPGKISIFVRFYSLWKNATYPYSQYAGFIINTKCPSICGFKIGYRKRDGHARPLFLLFYDKPNFSYFFLIMFILLILSNFFSLRSPRSLRDIFFMLLLLLEQDMLQDLLLHHQ